MKIHGDDGSAQNEGAEMEGHAICPTCSRVSPAMVLDTDGCPGCGRRSYGSNRLNYELFGNKSMNSKPVSWNTIHAVQGAIYYWLGTAAVGRMGVRIPDDEIPFWVSFLLDFLRDKVGIEFDMASGQWSGDERS